MRLLPAPCSLLPAPCSLLPAPHTQIPLFARNDKPLCPTPFALCLLQYISLPKGVKATPASLKCCMPNGIPIIVIHNSMPNTRWESEIQIPPIKIQIIFISTYRQPDDLAPACASLPKGQRASIPSLSVCIPKGMPIIVIINTRLAAKYSIAIKIPPKISQRMFPIVFI